MKFLSVDLETTGLKPGVHGVTEFGAVYTDVHGKVPMKTFYRWINPEGFVWSQYCLDLHHNWLLNVNLRIKANNWFGNPKICKDYKELAADFIAWVTTELGLDFYDKQNKIIKFTGAGKNFATFDLPFLKAIGFPEVFRHRVLDPVPLYVEKEDEVLPDFKTCKERAMRDGAKFDTAEIAHTGIQDALDIVDLIRFAYTHKLTLQ